MCSRPFDAAGEPSWWMEIILAAAVITAFVSLLASISFFGFVNTAVVVLGVPVIIIALADAIWGL